MVSIDSFLAGPMKPQVFTTITSASSGEPTRRKPSPSLTPSITSVSTRFFAQPSETKWMVRSWWSRKKKALERAFMGRNRPGCQCCASEALEAEGEEELVLRLPVVEGRMIVDGEGEAHAPAGRAEARHERDAAVHRAARVAADAADLIALAAHAEVAPVDAAAEA